MLNIGGILFRLIDTAGIREHTTDVIESAGMKCSLEKMKQADLVLYVFDAAEKPDAVKEQQSLFDQQQTNYLLIAKKNLQNQ